jgi:sortase A
MNLSAPKSAGRHKQFAQWPIAVLLLGFAVILYAYFGIRESIIREAVPLNVDAGIFLAKENPIEYSPKLDSVEVTKAEKVSYEPYPSKGDALGTITLPSLGLTWAIFQGTEKSQLAKGVGHFLGSVLPGEHDNSVLAGHRESVFNRLGELVLGDLISVSTSAGKFEYQIREFRIVERSDRTVIVPTPTAVLTLVTCYPFNYFGTTDKSYIVVADLVSSELS